MPTSLQTERKFKSFLKEYEAKKIKEGKITHTRIPKYYGDPKDKDSYFYMLSYSPYDQVEEKDYPDVAASFQEAVVDVLVKKLAYAIEQTGIKKLVCSGGVAANSLLRERLTDMGKTSELEVSYPKMEFCTDNAAMIAYAGFIRKKYNLKEYPTKYARPRWPLGELYD